MTNYAPSIMTVREEAGDAQIDRLLEEVLHNFETSGSSWVPSCNVLEDENGFYVQAALPGWEAHQIAVEVNRQILAIKGESSSDSGARRYHLQEISHRRFARAFQLPTFVDQEKATATHKNGMLTITFPKREEAKARRIQIEGQ